MHELPSPEDEELEQGNDLDERAEDANDQASKTKTDDITLSASETNSSPQMASKSSHQTLDSNSEQASNDEVIASDEPERHQLVTDRDKDSSSRRRRGLRNVPGELRGPRLEFMQNNPAWQKLTISESAIVLA